MLHGLDLFSGIGGNTIALREWVKTIAYCESDRHAQAVLLSRMQSGDIEHAPICDNIKDLDGSELKGLVDIIVGGFPCQDISVAGKGVGLEGKRSGLFFEVVRLAKEVEPVFLFLENVPAIRTRGLDTVINELSKLGYDCRWTTLSAQEVGANHKRDRWFLLAYSKRFKLRNEQRRGSGKDWSGKTESRDDGSLQPLADEPWLCSEWWQTQSDICRVSDGVPFRLERIRRLGNAVVPLQAKTAFKELMGI